MLSLALIVIGGIYLAAHLPQHVPLGPAIALLVASAAVLIVNLALLRRVEGLRLGSLLLRRQVGPARLCDHGRA